MSENVFEVRVKNGQEIIEKVNRIKNTIIVKYSDNASEWFGAGWLVIPPKGIIYYKKTKNGAISKARKIRRNYKENKGKENMRLKIYYKNHKDKSFREE